MIDGLDEDSRRVQGTEKNCSQNHLKLQNVTSNVHHRSGPPHASMYMLWTHVYRHMQRVNRVLRMPVVFLPIIPIMCGRTTFQCRQRG